MAITATAPTYTGTTSPAITGQVLAFGGSDNQEVAYKGFWTLTLDGAATSLVVNWIDGTNALFFTQSGGVLTAVAPSACLVSVCGGTQGAAAIVTVAADLLTTTGCTLRTSVAGTNANTLKVAFLALK